MSRLVLAAAFALSFTAFAQTPPPADPGPLLDEAKTAFSAGEISHARRVAEKAAQALAQTQGEAIRAFLPAAFDGWTIQEGDAASLAAIAIGGGVTVDRVYENADGTDVRIEILADSDIVEGMADMYTNPAVLEGSGLKIETIGGEQAMIDPQSGQITVILDKRSSVTISGSSTPEIVRSYAENINFAGLKAMK